MKTVAVFGGSGGLGKQIVPLLKEKYTVISLSSADVDIRNILQVNEFFSKNDIDIVINMTGTNYDTFVHKINSNNVSEIQKVLDTNINGNINVISSCLSKMREKNYGRIIVISSILSIKNIPGTSIYSSTKSFIDTFTRITSTENISKGITCNSIRLGYFDGGMCHRIPDNFKQIVKDNIGLKRWGSIPELYSTIEYLINNEYITGQNIAIEGGLKS